uniref:ATP synthase F0 subunit 8 n=1 Tax=Poecilochirus davydovae TaxID=3128885 RepID=UPI0030E1816B
MPQMAPMNWLLISPLSMILCLITLVLIYFSYNLLPNPKISNKSINKNNPAFKW